MVDSEKEKTVTEIVVKIKSAVHSQDISVDSQSVSSTNNSSIQYYSVSDFLLFHNEEFIQHAYRLILGREPDSQGFDHYLHQLRKGSAKIDVLYAIYSAQEARATSVKIRGLYLRWFLNRLFRLPIVGYVFRLVSGLFMLPVFIKNFENLDDFVKSQLVNSQHQQARSHEVLQALQKNSSELQTHVHELSKWVQQSKEFIKKENSQVEHLSALSNEMNFQLVTMQAEIVELSKRMAVVDSKGIPASKKHFYDELYVSFENRFRGNRSDIKTRFEVYLPYIAKLKNDLGDLSILDVGCGRGEWLELLKQNNYLAQGIDSNSMMIETCRQLDLNVSESDAIEFLTNAPSNNFDLITGFHIVEHLPFPILVNFFAHIHRCLKPKGMILLETPNPENIITGACDFYTDFTHIHPIPLNSLIFLAEFQNFIKPTILRLHEDTTVKIDEPHLQELLYGPRDYALIAFKP